MPKRKNKKKGGEEEGGEAWLLPYSDLMTLLLAVFIVLFAVSKMSQSKSEQMAAAFRNTLIAGGAGVLNNGGNSAIKIGPNGDNSGVFNGVATQSSETSSATGTEQQTSVGKESAQGIANPGTESQTSPINSGESQQPTDAKTGLSEKEYQNMDALKKQLDALFKSEGLDAETTTSIDSRGLVIHLNNVILFTSGSADIKSESIGTLEKIATIINSLDNYIRIEGHTDNVPISSSQYPSNWELSAARATSVVRLFVSQCNVSPDKLVAVGYGEYKPIADNSTPEGKAKNRRIDIIVLSDKYNNLENQ